MNKKKRDRRHMPTIAEVTRLIAKGGGNAPSRNGKAPGAEVIARGLERHAVWVEAMHVARREREM